MTSLTDMTKMIVLLLAIGEFGRLFTSYPSLIPEAPEGMSSCIVFLFHSVTCLARSEAEPAESDLLIRARQERVSIITECVNI